MNDHAQDTGSLHPAIAAVLRWFEFGHLRSGALRDVSEKFHAMAWDLATTLPADPQATLALQRLLTAKDAAVRATLAGLDASEQARLASPPDEA